MRAHAQVTRLALGVMLMATSAAGGLAAPPKVEYLSDLRDRILDAQQDWGVMGFDVTVHQPDRTPWPLRIKDKTYAKGIGTHANGEITVALDGEYEAFEAEVGLVWEENSVGAVVFQVFVDGRQQFDSGVMHASDAARPIHIPLAGAQELRLVVKIARQDITCCGANWADARFLRDPNARPRAEQQPMDIAPFARVVTCDPARTDGCRSGRLEEFRAEDVFLEWEIAPTRGAYAVPTYAGGLGCLGLQWPERRLLSRLALDFAPGEPVPPAKNVRVEYWSAGGVVDDNWSTTAETLWQGRWAPLPGAVEEQPGRLIFRIGSGVPEFDNRGGIHKIRWIVPAGAEPLRVRKLSALTRARWAEADFQLQLDRPLPGKQARVEMYNGYIVGQGGDATTARWDLGAPLRLKLRYTTLPHLPDRTVIRLQLPGGAFGVAIDDLLANDCVWVPDFGVFATRLPAPVTLARYRRSIAARKTILERVGEAPDQTLAHAREVLSDPRSNSDPMLLSLACDNAKFIVRREGSVRWDRFEMVPTFGSGQNSGLTRHLEDRWMPIPVTQVEEGGVRYRQRTFVAPFDNAPAPDLPDFLNREPLGVVEFTAENTGEQPATARLSLTVLESVPKPGTNETTQQTLALQGAPGGFVAVRDGNLLAFIDTSGSAPLSAESGLGGASLTGSLPPGATARCVVYLPRWAMKPEDAASLADGRDLVQATKDYWRRIVASAMQISVPDALVQDLYAASQVHLLIAARNEQAGALVAPWIAADTYGPLDTEAQPLILAFDVVGYHDIARRSLDYFLTRYNDRGALANGYTLMGTGQNLWTVGEHYGLTADRQWLGKVAPKLDLACRWINEQRAKTMRLDPSGAKVPEYGLAPPGVIADWGRYAYYFYINGYYCAGLKAIAAALADAGNPDAPALAKSAGEFQADLLRAYRFNQARMPVVPLRNGAWVPATPSSVYCFDLSKSFYPGFGGIGHDVEVGGNHLIDLGFLGPHSREADWAVNYLEDAWFFISGLAYYPAADMEKDWLTYSGFAKIQPYYTRYADVLALRDEVKPFVRNYFNSFMPTLSMETLAMWEHFHAVGAWCKTHEIAWMLGQTRTMLVMERGDALWLAPFVTNNWLGDGMVVAVAQAPTRFGPVAYRITSHVAEGYIEAEITPPSRRAPKEIVVRLRHPQGKPIKSATVNGRPTTRFDPARETVTVKPAAGPMVVRARY
jgi:hypothetical protein